MNDELFCSHNLQSMVLVLIVYKQFSLTQNTMFLVLRVLAHPKFGQEKFIVVGKTLEKAVSVENNAGFLLCKWNSIDEGKQWYFSFWRFRSLKYLGRSLTHLLYLSFLFRKYMHVLIYPAFSMRRISTSKNSVFTDTIIESPSVLFLHEWNLDLLVNGATFGKRFPFKNIFSSGSGLDFHQLFFFRFFI